MQGTDFEAVAEKQAVGVGAVLAGVYVEMELFDACVGCGLAHFVQKPCGVAFIAALGDGNDVVDEDVAAAGEVAGFAEAADGHGVVFAFFEDADEPVAGGPLYVVDLFDETLYVGQERAQGAEGGKGGGGFFGGDFAQDGGVGGGGFRRRIGRVCGRAV